MEGVIAKLEALVVKLEQSGSHGASVGKVEMMFHHLSLKLYLL